MICGVWRYPVFWVLPYRMSFGPWTTWYMRRCNVSPRSSKRASLSSKVDKHWQCKVWAACKFITEQKAHDEILPATGILIKTRPSQTWTLKSHDAIRWYSNEPKEVLAGWAEWTWWSRDRDLGRKASIWWTKGCLCQKFDCSWRMSQECRFGNNMEIYHTIYLCKYIYIYSMAKQKRYCWKPNHTVSCSKIQNVCEVQNTNILGIRGEFARISWGVGWACYR